MRFQSDFSLMGFSVEVFDLVYALSSLLFVTRADEVVNR